MLYLSKNQKDELISHAREGAPNEVCGILAGSQTFKQTNKIDIDKIFQMKNTKKSSIEYFMEPNQQLKIMKKIRKLNFKMVAIYHSHPESIAYPSDKDIKLAFYPENLYVIISLEDNNNPKIKAYEIENKKITEHKVK